jgi:hypothetical protein
VRFGSSVGGVRVVSRMRERGRTSRSCFIARRSGEGSCSMVSGKVLTIGTRMGNCYTNRMLFVMFAFAATNGGLCVGAVAPKVSDGSRRNSLITSYEKQRAMCMMFIVACPPLCRQSTRRVSQKWLAFLHRTPLTSPCARIAFAEKYPANRRRFLLWFSMFTCPTMESSVMKL